MRGSRNLCQRGSNFDNAVFIWWDERWSKIPLKVGHHRAASETPFRWRPNGGLTLNSGLLALRFFRWSGPVLLRKLFCDLSGGPYPLSPSPPFWIRPCQSRNFQPFRDVSWVEPVLNRVKCVLHKDTIWCLQRDSNQRPLKSSTLPLVDLTGIIQLFGHCIATWYVPVSFKAYGDMNQLWAWLDSDPKSD